MDEGLAFEREKISCWLMDRYLIKTGDHYRITKEDLAELRAGVKEQPEWNLFPVYQRIKKAAQEHTPTLLIQAIETFGEVSQREMAIEECAELIKALCKYSRSITEKTHADVLEETVDVSLAAEQMRYIFDHGDQFEEIRKKKLKRLQERIAAKDINAVVCAPPPLTTHIHGDGERTFEHTHKRGDVPHGHHGARYMGVSVASW